MDQDNMESTEAFDFSNEGASNAVDQKAKKKKLIIFSSIVVVMVAVAGAGIVSSFSGGDEFAAPPSPPPAAPLNTAAQVGQASGVGDATNNVVSNSPPIADIDPFAEVEPVAALPQVTEVAASEFDVLDELAQSEPVTKDAVIDKVDEAYQAPVAVVKPPVVDAQLPTPDQDSINHKTQKAIKVEPVSTAAPQTVNGFCLDKPAVEKMLDTRFAQLSTTLNKLQNELASMEGKLSRANAVVASSATASRTEADRFSFESVVSEPIQKAQAKTHAEDNINGKYFRVVGAMRGMAWLAVKGGDPVRLSEGDILKGFGLVEKISADGRIWTDKGKVPTRILR